MQQIYNTVDNSMKSYMYPKQAVTLDIKPATVEVEVEEPVTEQEQEVVSVVITETEELLEKEPIEVTVDPYALKKVELMDYVESLYGEDADVSGTKAEILARYFG